MAVFFAGIVAVNGLVFDLCECKVVAPCSSQAHNVPESMFHLFNFIYIFVETSEEELGKGCA